MPPFVRVAAVPAQHPYTRAVTDPCSVDLLEDPPVFGAPAGQWWPPRMLDAEWVRAHAGTFDVLHVHFGAESYSPEQVAAALAAARRAGKPVVYTVHDLENPQLSDQSAHRRMLDVLVAEADELVSLTESARDEIRARWGRTATVIPHPSLLGAAPAPTGRPAPFRRIGVHLRDLRPNVDAIGVVTTLIRAICMLRSAGARVEGVVRLNENVRDAAAAHIVEQVIADSDGVVLERGPRLDDDELTAWIADLDACILPYAHGTHSGWLELCFDLAVPVLGPAHGHFRSQHPEDYARFDVGDPVSMASAIERATSPASSRPGTPARAAEVVARAEQRRAQTAEVRAAHAALYSRLTARRVAA